MEIQILKQRLDDHLITADKKFESLSNDLNMIKENHLAHIQEDIGHLKIEMSGVKGDVKWIKLIGGAILIETLGVLLKLIFL